MRNILPFKGFIVTPTTHDTEGSMSFKMDESNEVKTMLIELEKPATDINVSLHKYMSLMEKRMGLFENLLMTMTSGKKTDPPSEASQHKAAWVSVGMVLDRLFLVIYIFVVIITFSILFPRP